MENFEWDGLDQEQIELLEKLLEEQKKLDLEEKKKSWYGEEEVDEEETLLEESRLKAKVRRAKTRQERREIFQRAYSEALDRIQSKSGDIDWVNPDQNGEIINGYLKERHLFEIKRGFSLYTLRIIDNDLREQYRKKTSFLTHNSPEYGKLKQKALKIVKNHLNETK